MKLILSVVFLLTTFVSLAQNKRQEEFLKHEGDNFFRDEQYVLAIEYYRELTNVSEPKAEVLYNLAESYRKVFNYQDAEVYYLKAYYLAPGKFPLALYYHALMLKLNANFDEATQVFTEFITTAESNANLKEYVEQAIIDRAGSEMAKSEQIKSSYKSVLESLNTAYNDFAPALRDTATLIITSSRVESNRQAIDDRYGEGFTDNLYFVKAGNSWQDKTKQVFNVTNTKYNEGSGCFNYTGDTYYYTNCGKSNTNCAIYASFFRNNKWSEPVALNEQVNAPNSETKHPAISKGGDTLMFASNRVGGMGNFDIWMSVSSGNENWGPAINMGPGVNTKLNELSPAFTIFPHIFFLSSDGHQNYGGFDLYMAKRFSNGIVSLYNLDFPFNSNRDDCFITMMGKKVYFSSNRGNGKGGFDVYSVNISSIVSFTSRIGLKSKGARGDVKLNARTETVSNLNLLTAKNEDRLEYENLTYAKKKIVERMLTSTSYKREDFPELTDQEFNDLTKIAANRKKIQQLERQFSGTLLSKLNTSGNTGDVSITGTVVDSVSGIRSPDKKLYS